MCGYRPIKLHVFCLFKDFAIYPKLRLKYWGWAFIENWNQTLRVLLGACTANIKVLSLTHRGGSWGGCHWSDLAGSGHRRCGSSPINTGTDTARGTGDTPGGGRWHNPYYTGYPSWWRFLRPSEIRAWEWRQTVNTLYCEATSSPRFTKSLCTGCEMALNNRYSVIVRDCDLKPLIKRVTYEFQ